ncbi:hypothetical protein VE04_09612 [Pseudogymnoascus sp. 24MN13]|nr:hypothetical protein VE04_09612 [Pseudogymnoascus sp. 24MN13]
MWPLFSCLSIPNIVGVIEAALSPTRRIIFVSHYAAMLTVAAETIRYCVRVYEWSGLYVPVVHARHATELVQEPGPYILGITAECRTLFTAPTDALVVDLDRNFVLTSSPPTALNAGQRTKMVNRMTQALNGDITPSGVPQHLRSAYGGGKLVPAGQIIVMRGEVESIQDPEWWNQDSIMAVMDHVCEKMGRNTGIKAVFGGAVKKPLMTKVSMRHLNEIVRERNQYSRDALEAWQDFINLKGRMDTELGKVTKRNNFLVEELESWKQQFLKFQAFAEQLTKETTDLKAKIESHKREARRLTSLIEQHKDDSARITVRLSGTGSSVTTLSRRCAWLKEIAEELARERHAQRVVLHLRSLISGQTHHMEHIVRTLGKDELAEYIENGDADEHLEDIAEEGAAPVTPLPANFRPRRTRLPLLVSRLSGGAEVCPEMETRLYNSPSASARNSKRLSNMSIIDVADRHLRDKTDAIAHIIRNISELCAAAVEGLQLAHDADAEAEAIARQQRRLAAQSRHSTASVASVASVSGQSEDGEAGSEVDESSLLHPGRASSIPPTPDLIHNRSSTAMSIASVTTTPERGSAQYSDLPTKIVEDSDEGEESSTSTPQQVEEMPTKGRLHESLLHRPSGARISALGGH